MKKKVVTINARREAYAISNCYGSLTVGQLIQELQEFPQDLPIYLSHDKGFIYGSILSDDIRTTLAVSHEMQFGNEIEISHVDYRRIDKLFDVDFEQADWDEDMRDLIEELGAKPNETLYKFEWGFKNGNRAFYELKSNDTEYHWEISLYDAQQDKIHLIDWEYGIATVQAFEYDEDTYNVYFKVIK